jgi:hypothetical protein
MSRFSIVRCCQARARHCDTHPASAASPAALRLRRTLVTRLRFSDLIVPLFEIAWKHLKRNEPAEALLDINGKTQGKKEEPRTNAK